MSSLPRSGRSSSSRSRKPPPRSASSCRRRSSRAGQRRRPPARAARRHRGHGCLWGAKNRVPPANPHFPGTRTEFCHPQAPGWSQAGTATAVCRDPGTRAPAGPREPSWGHRRISGELACESPAACSGRRPARGMLARSPRGTAQPQLPTIPTGTNLDRYALAPGRLRAEWQPDVVFQPPHHDVHQDHQTIAQEGLRAFKRTTILGYEIPWNNFDFSFGA